MIKPIAVIDLGTNTFNLLIGYFDGKEIVVLHGDKESVALGLGGINERKINDEATERAIKTLSRFKQKTDDFSVDKIYAIGTSAIRDANNQVAFCQKVKQETGIEVQVISGLEEANLIFQGVAATFPFSEDAVIMDIGGGSTEFISVKNQQVEWSQSFNIGVARILQKFTFSDPLSSEDVATIEDYLNEHTFGYLKNKRAPLLIGASGSFETFYELIHEVNFPKSLQVIELPFHEILLTLNKLVHSTQAEREQNQFILPIRRKMAHIAAVKVRWVLNLLQAEKTYVSPCSLKEGVLVQHYKNISSSNR